MSSPYPVLNNRSIDQWKVTELKEELRKRRLKTNGLKEELVRRLDGALRTEMEEAADKEAAAEKEAEAEQEEIGNGIGPDDDYEDKLVEEASAPPTQNAAEPVEDKVDEVYEEKPADKIDDAHNDVVMADYIDRSLNVNQGIEEKDMEESELVTTGLNSLVNDNAETAIPLENSMSEEKNVDAKPSVEDDAHSVSESAMNQVSEVSPDLEFQVKSESISTDTVSINEKNELKDNLNANNVNLELEVVNPDMVQPSIGGDLHPLENDREMVDNQASLEEADADITTSKEMDLGTKIGGMDVESPEKLNLDRSSGDESMEEDVLESKQIESKDSSKLGERSEYIKANNMLEEKPIDAIVGGFFPEKKEMVGEEEGKRTTVAERRKAEEEETVNKNEPKRRRWNVDPVKFSEPQTSTVTAIIPKDSFQPSLRRSFSRSDSSLSGDAPKERIVPPSDKPATTSLRIDRFLRPFTLKAVQELLAKTGKVSDFWMDHIKTHCYVTYSSVEEATASRNALYNLQWPTNGGRQLVAEFVDPQEVKMRVEGPPQSTTPVTPGPTTPISAPLHRQPQVAPPPPPPRTNSFRQQQLPPPPPLLPPPPALSNPPPVRERLPPPPPLLKKLDPPPIMTLDDIFKKTKATPRIYYLPLSEEQVKAKLAVQGKRTRA